jgi:hypothetical protein
VPSEILHVEERIDLPVPAGPAWAVVGDFADPSPWTVGLEAVESTGKSAGAIRQLRFPGGQVVERLDHRDDGSMTLTYSLLSGPLPVVGYVAELGVAALSPTASRVRWSARCTPSGIEPARLEASLRRAYRRNLDRLAELLLGNARAHPSGA